MSAVSRRSLLTMFRPKAEPFSLDAFYRARGERAAGPLPHVRLHDQGPAHETTNVGVPREVLGVVRIREKDCLAHGSFCTVCAERCPVEGAIVVELGRPRVDETRCNGCGICVGVCPAPVNAFDKLAREESHAR